MREVLLTGNAWRASAAESAGMVLQITPGWFEALTLSKGRTPTGLLAQALVQTVRKPDACFVLIGTQRITWTRHSTGGRGSWTSFFAN